MTSGEYKAHCATIERHGVSYGYGHLWKNSGGGHTSVSGAWFSTKEESDAAKLHALDAARYEPPRFWQWWRWGEATPDVWERRAKK